MQGELSSKDERCSNLELQINKLNQRCEVCFYKFYIRRTYIYYRRIYIYFRNISSF